MASGCILGECKLCEEFVWEDEPWNITDEGEFYHIDCVPKKIKKLQEELKLLKELEKRYKINEF